MKYFVRNTVFGNLMRLYHENDPLFPVPGAGPGGVLLNLREEANVPTAFESREAAAAAVRSSIAYGGNRFGWSEASYLILSEEQLVNLIITERKTRKDRRKGKKH